jgi:hypothetical protein
VAYLKRTPSGERQMIVGLKESGTLSASAESNSYTGYRQLNVSTEFGQSSMAISTLKIYLHDGSTNFRIQLVGELKEADLGELIGCWQTAKSSVEGRPLVIDVTKLKAADDQAIRWIREMLGEGATINDSHELTKTVPPRLSDVRVNTVKGLDQTTVGRWRSWFANIQRSNASGPVQAK